MVWGVPKGYEVLRWTIVLHGRPDIFTRKPVLLRRRGRRRYRFFAFFDVKKRGFAYKPSRYAYAGRPKIIGIRTDCRRAGESEDAVINATIECSRDWVVRSREELLEAICDLEGVKCGLPSPALFLLASRMLMFDTNRMLNPG